MVRITSRKGEQDLYLCRSQIAPAQPRAPYPRLLKLVPPLARVALEARSMKRRARRHYVDPRKQHVPSCAYSAVKAAWGTGALTLEYETSILA
jgi:hypothetical protein